MSKIQANPTKTAPGFWTRLALAFEDISDSHPERLEKRLGRLEAEVKRLSVIERTFAGLGPKR